jgi:hypothetical protein
MAATYDERLKEIKVVFDLVDFESDGGVLTARLDDIIRTVERFHNWVAYYSLTQVGAAMLLGTTVQQLNLFEKIYKFHRLQVRPCPVGMSVCVCVSCE